MNKQKVTFELFDWEKYTVTLLYQETIVIVVPIEIAVQQVADHDWGKGRIWINWKEDYVLMDNAKKYDEDVVFPLIEGIIERWVELFYNYVPHEDVPDDKETTLVYLKK